jgi:F0F1-type ATP synthase membrane subunit c/vacuolar-type H+-ATPase subunit K
MAGILGIYGLVVSVLIANTLSQKAALYTSLVQLGAGLSVGFCGLAAGYVAHLYRPRRLYLTCQVCYWNRGGCGRERNGAAASALCGHDTYSDLC